MIPFYEEVYELPYLQLQAVMPGVKSLSGY
jgi:hypothetical protein